MVDAIKPNNYTNILKYTKRSFIAINYVLHFKDIYIGKNNEWNN
jgi:hypothetical protein